MLYRRWQSIPIVIQAQFCKWYDKNRGKQREENERLIYREHLLKVIAMHSFSSIVKRASTCVTHHLDND